MPQFPNYVEKEKYRYNLALKKGLKKFINPCALMRYMVKEQDFKYMELLPALNFTNKQHKDMLWYELFMLFTKDDYEGFGIEKMQQYFQKGYSFPESNIYHTNLAMLLFNRFEMKREKIHNTYNSLWKLTPNREELEEKMAELFSIFEDALETFIFYGLQLNTSEVLNAFLTKDIKHIDSWNWLFIPSIDKTKLLTFKTPKGNIFHDYCAWLATQAKKYIHFTVLDEYGYYTNNQIASVLAQSRSQSVAHAFIAQKLTDFESLSIKKKEATKILKNSNINLFFSQKDRFANEYVAHMEIVLDLLSNSPLCYNKMIEVNTQGNTPDTYFINNQEIPNKTQKDMQMLYLKKVLELKNIDKESVSNRRRYSKI